ncbi:MAG: hypothetical protein E7399_02510 [Ruminococcaceae bacterium]|nr:hypothetical protein [Oscillospiraceae bacterium]
MLIDKIETIVKHLSETERSKIRTLGYQQFRLEYGEWYLLVRDKLLKPDSELLSVFSHLGIEHREEMAELLLKFIYFLIKNEKKS